MAVLVLISWYSVGFLAATHLVRRGHDRTVWTIAAALTGGMVAVAAVVVTAQRALRPDPSLVARPAEIAVVVDRDPDVALTSLGRLRPWSSVDLVALLSHEADARWVDTGERAESRRRIEAHRARAPFGARETLLTGSPADLSVVRARVLVLPRDRDDRSRRHDAWRVLTAARASGAAVLSPAAMRTTPSPRVAAAPDEKASV